MNRIFALFTGGLSKLLSNWKQLLVVGLVVYGVHTILSVTKEIGSLSEITKQNGEEMKAIRGQLSDLKNVSDQMLAISQQQMAITQKLDADYEARKAKNDADTAANVNAVNNGTLRLSIRKPVTPAKHPVPYPASTGK